MRAKPLALPFADFLCRVVACSGPRLGVTITQLGAQNQAPRCTRGCWNLIVVSVACLAKVGMLFNAWLLEDELVFRGLQAGFQFRRVSELMLSSLMFCGPSLVRKSRYRPPRISVQMPWRGLLCRRQWPQQHTWCSLVKHCKCFYALPLPDAWSACCVWLKAAASSLHK